MPRYRERIPCDPNTPCTLKDKIGCFEDHHHEAYPKDNYVTPLEKKFRSHAANIVLICRMIHQNEHAQKLPPKKPSPEEMEDFLRRY